MSVKGIGLELNRFPLDHQESTTSIDGHVFKKEESPTNCCTVAKKWFLLKACGQPYRPLSERQIVNNYSEAWAYLISALVSAGATGYVLYLSAKPSDKSDGISATVAGSALGFYTLALAYVGTKKFYNTCKAPRIGERAALLSSPGESV